MSQRTACVALYGGLLLFSFIQSPVPGVNEPHYLTKARSYWQPDWCERDYFLTSSNPHQFFYQTFGSLTGPLAVSDGPPASVFASAAIWGRLVGLALLAWGWVHGLSAVSRDPETTLTAGSLFLLSAALTTLSGEWVVGGMESKVPAWALVLWAVRPLVERRYYTASVLLGLAVAFHPVVGVWAIFCAVIGLLWRDASRLSDWFAPAALRNRTAPCILIMVVCSLPGLIPAIASISGSQLSAVERLDADFIQVFIRLNHHLDPMHFPAQRYAVYLVMLAAWCWIQWRNPQQAGRGFWMPFVLAAALLAGIGFLLGWGPRPATEMAGFAWRGWLLKFYPFRLIDILMPIALSLSLAEVWRTAVIERTANDSQPRTVLRWLLPAVLVAISCSIPVASRNPSRMPADRWQDWIRACEWIDAETSADALIMTPRQGWGFKWYAGRAEYFSPKDCPQDSAGLLEWFARSRVAKRFEGTARTEKQYSAQLLLELQQTTSADYVVVNSALPGAIEAVYTNDHFAIYDLRSGEL